MEPAKKPALPSFHTLLSEIEEIPFNKSRTIGHRRHKSDHLSAFKPFQKDEPTTSILPGFEKLSIQSIPVEHSLSKNITVQSKPSHQQRPPRNLHSRSYSDFSHPYPSNGPPHRTGPQVTTFHRRAISATDLDFILQPIASSHSYNSNSLHSSPFPSTTTSSSKSIASVSHVTIDQSIVPADFSVSGFKSDSRYHCSYCNKGFSRPSSLRIHTYSHTGERPFECPNPSCSRKFSVQSNLRRHMRIHRTGKVLKFADEPRSEVSVNTGVSIGAAGQINRSQLALKPLAAKPTDWFN